MIKANDPKTPKSRRGFLLGASTAAGAGAAVALTAGKLKPESPTPVAPEDKGRGGGYHLSERVKQYYRSTLV